MPWQQLCASLVRFVARFGGVQELAALLAVSRATRAAVGVPALFDLAAGRDGERCAALLWHQTWPWGAEHDLRLRCHDLLEAQLRRAPTPGSLLRLHLAAQAWLQVRGLWMRYFQAHADLRCEFASAVRGWISDPLLWVPWLDVPPDGLGPLLRDTLGAQEAWRLVVLSTGGWQCSYAEWLKLLPLQPDEAAALAQQMVRRLLADPLQLGVLPNALESIERLVLAFPDVAPSPAFASELQAALAQLPWVEDQTRETREAGWQPSPLAAPALTLAAHFLRPAQIQKLVDEWPHDWFRHAGHWDWLAGRPVTVPVPSWAPAKRVPR